MPPGWPARLRAGDQASGEILIRPIRRRDQAAWFSVRERNREWLSLWDGTAPDLGDRPRSFLEMVRAQLAAARAGRGMPFVIEYDGRLVGGISVNNIVRGSAYFASLGYWIDRDVAGRGIMPLAVAMVIDHCFSAAGLHRIEISIRPENTASLRVVEKLGIQEVGYAPRYLHIDGAWRDHRMFAITVEECPQGLRSRLSQQSHQ